MSTIQVPVTFDSANRKKDRTVGFRFTTNLEITTDDYAEMDRLINQAGWLLFRPNEFQAEDVPTADAPGKDGKKPSLRLRGALWHLWDQQTDRSEPFELYYERQMDRIIQTVTERLA